MDCGDYLELALYRRDGSVRPETFLIDTVDWRSTGFDSQRWSLSARYVACAIYGPMHRAIMSTPNGLVVDHANGNRLDNRKGNLRPATPQQNRWNAVRQSTTPGVFRNPNGTYRAYISLTFASEADAMAQRRSWESAHFGDFSIERRPV